MSNASTWNNGQPNPQTGSGYGLRIDASYASNIFQQTWTNVILHLSGLNIAITVNISPAAKSGGCPELRHQDIGNWLISNNKAQWPHGQPYRVTLIQRGNSNVFDVI